MEVYSWEKLLLVDVPVKIKHGDRKQQSLEDLPPSGQHRA